MVDSSLSPAYAHGHQVRGALHTSDAGRTFDITITDNDERPTLSVAGTPGANRRIDQFVEVSSGTSRGSCRRIARLVRITSNRSVVMVTSLCGLHNVSQDRWCQGGKRPDCVSGAAF